MIPKPHNDRFLVAGDWHGNIKQALHVVKQAQLQDIDTIIQVGDFMGYKKDLKFISRLRYALETSPRPIQLYFVDGNHEPVPYLYSIPIDPETGLRSIRHNIHHLPRGYRWEWDGISFMGVGGAPSIKKIPDGWWPEEAITEEDVQRISSQPKVDVMFCHDSPITAPNSVTSNQDWAISHFGPQAVKYCTEHRQRLAEITNKLTPRLLFHGHFHKFMQGTYVHMDENATTAKVIGLNQGTDQNHGSMKVSFGHIKREIHSLNCI